MDTESQNSSEEKKVTDAASAVSGGQKKSRTRAASPRTRKKKTARSLPSGNVYILASYNNTIVTIGDKQGNVLSWSSAGQSGFKGPKKSTPYAASMIVRNALEKLGDVGLKDVDVFVKGIGQGREGAVRALNANGLQVLSITDVTPLPHNGPRRKRPRRV